MPQAGTKGQYGVDVEEVIVEKDQAMESRVTTEDRHDLVVKVQSFNRLSGVFKEFGEQTRSFLSTGMNSEVVGLAHDGDRELSLRGFGHRIFADWRFVLHNGKAYGELRFYRADPRDNEMFFRLYFDTQGNGKSDVTNETCEFFLGGSRDMESLYFTVLKSFFTLSCFKP